MKEYILLDSNIFTRLLPIQNEAKDFDVFSDTISQHTEKRQLQELVDAADECSQLRCEVLLNEGVDIDGKSNVSELTGHGRYYFIWNVFFSYCYLYI